MRSKCAVAAESAADCSWAAFGAVGSAAAARTRPCWPNGAWK